MEVLDDLRREIDRIDDALLDLLIERVHVVRRIGLVKNDRPAGRLAMRPAREAAILRRLVERAEGRLPEATIVAMWRELLAATTRLQTPFVVSVHVPSERQGLWDVTRGHFGSLAPLLRADTPNHALRSLGAGAAQLAVLPMPDETDLWWRGLVFSSEPKLRIVARLPFCPSAGNEMAAVVVAALELEPSGDDVTILAIEAAIDMSRARLHEALTAGGLSPRWLAAVREPEQDAALHLLEVPGYMGPQEPELMAALAPIQARVLRVAVIGGYARPLDGVAQR
jgi:chorismate mutase / prephenate dehydratase